MNILKHTVYLLLLTLCMAACRGCDDDVACDDPTDMACPNYDPCWGKERVSAAFEMEERISHPDSIWYIPSDTVVAYNWIRFRALQEADSVRWTLGSDPRSWHDREFSIRFTGSSDLYVTLVLWRQPDTLCHPGDPGVDTVRRRLEVVWQDEAAILGTYYGATDENPLDSFEVRMLVDTSLGARPLRLTGIHPGCNNLLLPISVIGFQHVGYSAFAFHEMRAEVLTGCLAPQGLARLTPDRSSVHIHYRRRNSFTDLAYSPYTTFRGRRR